MRVALSAKLKERSLCVVETLEWDGAKTAGFSERLDALSWNTRTLFVSGGPVPETLQRSCGNLQGIDCVSVEDLNVYDVVLAKRLVLDVAAVEWLEERYSKVTGFKPAAYPLEMLVDLHL